MLRIEWALRPFTLPSPKHLHLIYFLTMSEMSMSASTEPAIVCSRYFLALIHLSTAIEKPTNEPAYPLRIAKIIRIPASHLRRLVHFTTLPPTSPSPSVSHNARNRAKCTGVCRSIVDPTVDQADLQTAVKRIKKEVSPSLPVWHACAPADMQMIDLAKEDLGDITLTPNEANIFAWIAVLPGPAGSPYEGGMFEVDIKIPEDYPYVPSLPLPPNYVG
jgi:hypothetical protein